MRLKFFGQFLLEENYISSYLLGEALELMDQTNRKLGELAEELGYLKKSQIQDICCNQKIEDALFGELAVKQCLLSETQVKDLLAEQEQKRLRIGDAIVQLGFLSSDKIETYYNEFEREQRKLRRAPTLPPTLVGNPLVEFLVEFLPRISLRLAGVRLKIVDGCQAVERHMKEYTASIMITGEGDLNLMLTADNAFATRIMDGLLGGQLADEDAPPQLNDVLGEFLSIIAGNSLRALHEEGMRGKLGKPQYAQSVPPNGFTFILVSTVGTGSLIIGCS